MLIKEKMENLYNFEKSHTIKGIFKINDKENKIWENMLDQLTEKEYIDYEKEYYE